MDKRKCGKILGGMERLDLQWKNSGGNHVDRNEEEDKRGNAKEESEDKETERGRESVVRQGVGREEKGL